MSYWHRFCSFRDILIKFSGDGYVGIVAHEKDKEKALILVRGIGHDNYKTMYLEKYILRYMYVNIL